LLDPKRRFRNAIARYPLDDVVDAASRTSSFVNGSTRAIGCNDALRDFIDRALKVARTIDRYFWLDAAADLIGRFPEDERPDLFRSAARRIHANFKSSRRERPAAERFLARRSPSGRQGAFHAA
jgi:hypothetical protein